MEILHCNFTCDMGVAMCEHCPGDARLRFGRTTVGSCCRDAVLIKSGVSLLHITASASVRKCSPLLPLVVVTSKKYIISCKRCHCSMDTLGVFHQCVYTGWIFKSLFRLCDFKSPRRGKKVHCSSHRHGRPDDCSRYFHKNVACGAVTVPQARAAAAESSFITPLKGKVAQAAGGGEGLEVKKGTVTVTARQ